MTDDSWNRFGTVAEYEFTAVAECHECHYSEVFYDGGSARVAFAKHCREAHPRVKPRWELSDGVIDFRLSKEAPDFAGAACASFHDPEAFFIEDDAPTRRKYLRAEIAELRTLCRSCPVRVMCAEWALENEGFGLWAGLTIGDRARIRKMQGKDSLRGAVPMPSVETVKQVLAEMGLLERVLGKKQPRGGNGGKTAVGAASHTALPRERGAAGES